MPEMTETQTPGHKPKKKKNKESHNAVERHRKEKINAGINRIGNLLPCSQALKQSKIMILDQAFRYITELKKQNDTMLLEGGDKVQVEEIRRLRRQLEELRRESAHYIELLKAHDINFLEDPTIHWKGKQRCAKVAKVTPTHQLPKGIIVYSNNKVICPAGTDTIPPKHPSESLILQPPSDVGTRLRVNGALLQVESSSSTPALLPSSTIQSASVPLMEQCVLETQSTSSSLPPSVSYITLQIPAVTSAVLQAPQRSNPAPNLTIASTPSSQPTGESCAELASSHKTFANAITAPRQGTSEVCSWVTQGTTRTVSSITVPSSQALLRNGAAGSTQTTWTTLQMAGNTVQPVCQSLLTPEVISTTPAVQQVTVCPIGNKHTVQPFQIQMQPRMPVQQAPITAHLQRPPQILNQTQAQPLIAPQPQCPVLPQAANSSPADCSGTPRRGVAAPACCDSDRVAGYTSSSYPSAPATGHCAASSSVHAGASGQPSRRRSFKRDCRTERKQPKCSHPTAGQYLPTSASSEGGNNQSDALSAYCNYPGTQSGCNRSSQSSSWHSAGARARSRCPLQFQLQCL
ncbi:hypothetical protein fugu_015973 [Takifugu bimaculatus]|uniref:BHLH domain-containing protein n=1 Tax=Takifugu bimaculatus TaxID=433685 RepID=A0A4Z2BWF3_9TELE|nr:hypothetical protein fugu_015973 [Takifugu bimaculatus]